MQSGKNLKKSVLFSLVNRWCLLFLPFLLIYLGDVITKLRCHQISSYLMILKRWNIAFSNIENCLSLFFVLFRLMTFFSTTKLSDFIATPFYLDYYYRYRFIHNIEFTRISKSPVQLILEGIGWYYGFYRKHSSEDVIKRIL